MGYNRKDKDQHGMLGMNDGKGTSSYKIVGYVKDALKFPSKNVDKVTGFGTPEQWLEFFSSEPELKDWKFHLMKILAPSKMK